jgi:hypothetical protein
MRRVAAKDQDPISRFPHDRSCAGNEPPDKPRKTLYQKVVILFPFGLAAKGKPASFDADGLIDRKLVPV